MNDNLFLLFLYNFKSLNILNEEKPSLIPHIHNVSPTGSRPALEQFGSMTIEFLQENLPVNNQKEWSVSTMISNLIQIFYFGKLNYDMRKFK